MKIVDMKSRDLPPHQKYGFRVYMGFPHDTDSFLGYNDCLACIVSWIAINICEYDSRTWHVRFDFHCDINPMRAKIDHIIVCFATTFNHA